jgi:hypothetical protein
LGQEEKGEHMRITCKHCGAKSPYDPKTDPIALASQCVPCWDTNRRKVFRVKSKLVRRGDVVRLLYALAELVQSKPGFKASNFADYKLYLMHTVKASRQLVRCTKLLTKAARADIMPAAMNAALRSNPRLNWNGTSVTYTANQLYAAEYRLAVEGVLRAYLEGRKNWK